MRDCILEWHRQNPNNIAVGSLSYALSQQPSGSTSTLLLAVASASPSPAAATYSLTADEERRMYDLERELMALHTKNNNGLLRRSPRTHAGAVPAQPTSRDTPEPTGTVPAPATAVAPAAPLAAPAPPPEAAPPPQAAPRAAEHPFAHARDATYAPPTNRNIGAPPPKQSKETREPTYRTVASIDNPETLGRVLGQVLKASSVHLSNAELLAISPPLRDELCKQLTPKRVATEKDGTTYLSEASDTPTLPSVEELLARLGNEKLPPGIIHVPDPYEAYLSGLGPHDHPRRFTVAKESHALCSITAMVRDQHEVKCVIDSGSQIVSMSEATCHALGVAYDPSVILNMQSANGSLDASLGLARNVPFCIGDLILFMQVHVIREATYDILLSRPFNVLTESVVRNYRNEDQTLQLHCPNSSIVITVPTLLRGKPRFLLPNYSQDF